jgi:hypothetical protein
VDAAPFAGRRVTYPVTAAGAEPVTIVSQEGLFDLLTQSSQGETKIAYSIDVVAAEPLRFDQTLSFEITSTGPMVSN